MSALLRPITKAFDSILERRLLPIRSITAQVRRGLRCLHVLPALHVAGGWGGSWAQHSTVIAGRRYTGSHREIGCLMA